MTQYARPAQDISAGSWTDEGTVDNDGSLYTSIDEVTSDADQSYIQDAGANSTCEVLLSSIDDPQVDTGHVIHVLFRSTGSGGPERLTIDLYQGTTLIEEWANETNRSGSYTDLNTTLTAASSITDYSDLRVRLTASNLGGSETMNVTQVYLEAPDAPTGTDASDSQPAYLEGVIPADQAHFRVRDDSYGLNVDNGWLANLDVSPSTIDAETTFRIRFEVEVTGGTINQGYRLQFRKNAGTWTDLYTTRTVDETARSATNGVESWPTGQYTDGDATTDVLSGSALTFVAGTGKEAPNNQAAAVSLNNQHTELEFAVRIHKFYDGPSINADGDTFDFRLVDDGGSPLDVYSNTPSMDLAWPNGLIGGCYNENPDFIGPVIDTNGNMYFAVEYAETEPQFIMLKSTDDGVTWTPQDVANRPSSTDMEGWGCAFDPSSGVIHILQEDSSGDVWYHQFRTSDHATNPDTWGETDTTIEGGTTADQYCSVVLLSDGRLRGFWYGNGNQPRYGTRSAGGTWTVHGDFDSEAVDFEQVTAVLSPSTLDLVHVFYRDSTNGLIYRNTLDTSGNVGTRQQIASGVGTGTSSSTSQAILPPVSAWEDNGEEKLLIVYAKSDHYIYANMLTDGVLGTEQSVSDYEGDRNAHGGSNSAPQAGAFFDTETWSTHVLYADATPSDFWYDKTDPGTNTWGTDTVELAHTVMWVRGIVYTPSSRVIGYTHDDGNEAGQGGQGTGYIWYSTIVLYTAASDSQPAYLEGTTPSTPASDSQPAYLAGQDSASDSQPAYLAGVATGSSSQPAFLQGSESAQDAQPAYLAGQASALYSQPAYLEGASAGGQASDAQPAYLAGKDSASGAKPAYLTGQDSASGAQTAFLAGEATGNGAQTAFLQGQADGLASQTAYLAGQDSASGAQPAFLQGQATGSGSQPAFLLGGIDASASQPAYLNASGNPANASQPAFLAGVATGSSSQPAYLRGSLDQLDAQPAFLQGQADALGSQPAFLLGQADALSAQTAFLAGLADALGAQTAFLQGYADDLASQPAFLLGGIDASASQPAYLNASGNPANDSQPAFLQGQATGSGSQPAYLAGQESASGAQPAYLEGKPAAQDASSSQPAYLAGQDAGAASQTAFLVGQDTTTAEQPAFLAGQELTSASQSAFLQGQATGSGSQAAFLVGALSTAGSLAAFLQGKAEASGSIPAFLTGPGTDATDSQAAYLIGEADAVGSQPAFMLAAGIIAYGTVNGPDHSGSVQGPDFIGELRP